METTKNVAHDDHPEFALLLAVGYEWATNMGKENTPYTDLVSEIRSLGDRVDIGLKPVIRYPHEVVDNIRRAGYAVQVSEFAFDIYGERLNYMVSVWKRKKEDTKDG